MKRRLGTVLGISAACTAVSMAFAPSAFAVYVYETYYGNRGFAQVLSATSLRACDTLVDGRHVWSTYRLSNGFWNDTYSAPSGGCTYKYHSIAITDFAVCVEGLGCGYLYANAYVRNS